MYRQPPRTIDEKVAYLEEQVRRLQGGEATRPVITDYTALDGTPTDLVTVGALNAQLVPLEAAVDDVTMLEWLGGPT